MSTTIPPYVPTPEELYDFLMGQIEPELTLASIPGLQRKYREETEQERQARMGRYKKAYAAYEQALAQYTKDLEQRTSMYRREAFASAEVRAQKQEENRLADLEASIHAA